jgi:hypothetical protein
VVTSRSSKKREEKKERKGGKAFPTSLSLYN